MFIKVFQQLILATDAIITKREQLSFILMPGGGNKMFYGLRLTEDTSSDLFHDKIRHLIDNLKSGIYTYI